MIVCVTLGPDGSVGQGLGRAARVAVADIEDDQVTWEEHQVGWDALHGQGTEGAHHARIVRFLREHGVETVVTGHVGPGMQRTLESMGVRMVLGGYGDPRDAVVRAAAGGG